MPGAVQVGFFHFFFLNGTHATLYKSVRPVGLLELDLAVGEREDNVAPAHGRNLVALAALDVRLCVWQLRREEGHGLDRHKRVLVACVHQQEEGRRVSDRGAQRRTRQEIGAYRDRDGRGGSRRAG